MIPACRRHGLGGPLLCHPGGPGFSALYFGDLGGLGSSFELIQIDPRGTGASEVPVDARAYAIDDYVSDLEELRADLGLETIDLLGHSHGGVVAIAYAAAFPARVKRLVLASSLARFSPQQAEQMERSMAAKSGEPWYDEAREAIADEVGGRYTTPEELAEIVRLEFPFYFARYGEAERAWVASLGSERLNVDALKLFNAEIVETFDLRPELARIEARTLVITGAEDFITGPPSAREISAGIGGSQLVIVPGSGHLLFVEQPERFRTAVETFLSG